MTNRMAGYRKNVSAGYDLYVVPELLAYLIAFGGGILSFVSPCVLPLVPAYLSVVTGLEVADVNGAGQVQMRRIVSGTALFVAGFGTVFVLLGLSATVVGRALESDKVLLTRLSGAVVVAMAVVLLLGNVLHVPWLQTELRIHLSPSRFGRFAAPVAGAAFGFGWTACSGPVLAAVLAVAGSSGNAFRGATLLGTYALGLGLCFLATGLAAGRLASLFGWVRSHFRSITVSSALVMGALGVLLMLNKMTLVTVTVQSGLEAAGLGRLAFLA